MANSIDYQMRGALTKHCLFLTLLAVFALTLGGCEKRRSQTLPDQTGTMLIAAASPAATVPHEPEGDSSHEVSPLGAPLSKGDLERLARRNIADALTAQARGDYQKALDYYLKAVEQGATTLGLSYQIGVALYQLDRPDEATSYFDASIGKRQEVAESNNMLGIIAGNKGDSRRALEYFERAMKAAEYSPQAFYNAGETYRRLGDFTEASKMYAEAIKRKPNEPLYTFKFNLCRVDSGQDRGIEREITNQLEMDSPTGDWYLIAAYDALRNKRTSIARDYLTQAREIMTPSVFFAMLNDPLFSRFSDEDGLREFFRPPADLK